MPAIRIDIDWEAENLDLPETESFRTFTRTNPEKLKDAPRKRNRLTRPPRSEADQAFKCGHCKQFIGAPVTGGRHRNHCPNCLWSRHVDLNRPGDRRSDCHAMMEPAGVVMRRNGEQVIIHRCLGCGKEDPNRIAADDNPLLIMRLKPVPAVGLELLPDDTDAAEESA